MCWGCRECIPLMASPWPRKPQEEGTDEPAPERAGGYPGHDIRNGRSDRRQLVVAIAFSPLPRREGGAYALGGELRREERILSRTRVCMDRVGAYDDLSDGVFAYLPPPISGKTGVVGA
jgi:hypothetical protein